MEQVNKTNRIKEQEGFTKRTHMLEEEEIAWISQAEVIDGYYSLYCRITSIYGQTFYVPMTRDSDVTPGEMLDPSRIVEVRWCGPVVITWDKPKASYTCIRQIAY